MRAEYIENQIDSGKTLYINTCLKSIEVTKKTLDQWRKAGVSLFKDGDNTGFYIARGKKYDFVLLSSCRVEFV